MKRNNFLSYNLHQYDEQLSLFGRRVLRTLIKQWNIGRDEGQPNKSNTIHHRRPHSAPKRTITFGEPTTSAPNKDAALLNSINFECEGDDNNFDLLSELNSRAHAALSRNTPQKSFPVASVLSPPPNFVNPPLPSVSTALDLVSAGDDNFNFPELNPGAALLHSRELPLSVMKPPLPSSVPTSAQLIATADSITSQGPCKFTYNDLNTSISTDVLQPQSFLQSVECERNSNHLEVAFHVNDNAYGTAKNFALDNEDTNDKHNKRQKIDWDDIFDTELLSDIDASTDKSKSLGQISNEKKCQIDIPKNKTLIGGTINKASKKPKIYNDSKKFSNKLQNKNEKQIKVTDIITKKVKKVECIGPKKTKTQRKNQRGSYSNNITDWLNDVDPKNAVEGSGEHLEENQDDLEGKVQINKPEMEIEKPAKNKMLKNVIQAQLTNKGGIMKYDKPKKKKDDEVKIKTKESDTKFEEKNKVKEKRSKPKFMVPIKSQIPVKDITYEILGFKDFNLMNPELENNNNKEIVIVLIYSNGFCQLNEQHTDAACVPEGLLFYTDEKTYYLDQEKKVTIDTLRKVLLFNTVICYEGKAILNFLESKFDINIDNPTIKVIDTKIAGALLEPDSPPENFAELQKVAGSSAEFTLSTECPRQKAAWYAGLLQGAAVKLREKLTQEKLYELFLDIEMNLLPIIAGMEQRGVCVDLDKLKLMEVLLQRRMKLVEDACVKAAGRSFQLTSHVQIRAIIYDELQLDKRVGLAVRGTIATGAKSTSEAMLRSLSSVHPLPKLILEYRQLHKAYTTFVAGIKQHVRDGVVKPTWVQTAAATGRIASNNPNLQAIPKVPFDLSGFSGSEGSEGEGDKALVFRSVYVARPGRVILAADWRHVECRVFARAADDTALQQALEAPDLFRRLAADWLKKPEDTVSSADRERTKRIVYASLYGAGPRKLMDILDVDYGQALSIGISFDRTFPALRGFGRTVAERCRSAGGKVQTLCGRARRLPHISSADQQQRAQAERQALNFIVQGSAADICKWATVVATRALSEHGLRARLLLTIHDELVWEVFENDLNAAAQVIRSSMETCGARAGLASLPVAIAVGPNWGELQPYLTPGTPFTSPPLSTADGSGLD